MTETDINHPFASIRDRGNQCDFLAALVPVVLLAGLVVTYLTSPEFYLTYVLSFLEREWQAVEFVTFFSAFLAAALLGWSALKLFRSSSHVLPAVLLITVVAAAAFFFAGEEISWGQHFLGWDTPETYRELSGETNLHNTDIPVQSLGSVFLIVVFFGLPLAWWMRETLNLPEGLAPAVAEWPVVFSMAVAFIWKEVKNVYCALVRDYEAKQVYIDFIEQINEHKEMLVAVTLLLYSLYRLRTVRSKKAQQPDG